MKEGGINASEGANALKSGLAALINPTGKAKEMLEGFGINIEKIVQSNKGDVKGLVIDFASALDTLDPLARAQAIEQLFGKFQFSRLSTLFQNVIKDGTQAQRVLELSNATTQELAILSKRELGKIEQTTTYKFEKAFADFQAAIAPVGEEFLKLITPVIEFGTKLLQQFNNMDAGVKQFVVGLTVVLGGIFPALLMTVGLFANGIANILKLVSAVSMMFRKTSGDAGILGNQFTYMTQTEIQAAAAAASLDQVHSKLRQTFTAEKAAVDALTTAYQRNIAAQRGAGAGGAVGRRPKPATGYASGIVSVPGPKGAGDIVPAMLAPGEAVIPAKMAKKYGGLINGMISGNIPGYKTGRTVSYGGNSFEVAGSGNLGNFTKLIDAVKSGAAGVSNGGAILQETFKRLSNEGRNISFRDFSAELMNVSDGLSDTGLSINKVNTILGSRVLTYKAGGKSLADTYANSEDAIMKAEYARAKAASEAAVKARKKAGLEPGQAGQIDRAHQSLVSGAGKQTREGWNPALWVMQASDENQMSEQLKASAEKGTGLHKEYLGYLEKEKVSATQKAEIIRKVNAGLALTDKELMVQKRILDKMLADSNSVVNKSKALKGYAIGTVAAAGAREQYGITATSGSRSKKDVEAAEAKLASRLVPAQSPASSGLVRQNKKGLSVTQARKVTTSVGNDGKVRYFLNGRQISSAEGAAAIEKVTKAEARNAQVREARANNSVMGTDGKERGPKKPGIGSRIAGSVRNMGGMGAGMGLGIAGGAMAMVPGLEKLGTSLTVAGAAMMMIPGPVGLVIAGLSAMVGIVMTANDAIELNRRKVIEAADANSINNIALKQLSEDLGTVSPTETAADARDASLTGTSTAILSRGEEILSASAGAQQILEGVRTQFENTDDAQKTGETLGRTLSTAVLEGILSQTDAASLASAIGYKVGNINIAEIAAAQVTGLTGNLSTDMEALLLGNQGTATEYGMIEQRVKLSEGDTIGRNPLYTSAPQATQDMAKPEITGLAVEEMNRYADSVKIADIAISDLSLSEDERKRALELTKETQNQALESISEYADKLGSDEFDQVIRTKVEAVFPDDPAAQTALKLLEDTEIEDKDFKLMVQSQFATGTISPAMVTYLVNSSKNNKPLQELYKLTLKTDGFQAGFSKIALMRSRLMALAQTASNVIEYIITANNIANGATGPLLVSANLPPLFTDGGDDGGDDGTDTVDGGGGGTPEDAQLKKLNTERDKIQKALNVIALKEDAINKIYDKRKKALEDIAKINSNIADKQKTQLTIAGALASGDIAAAARAVQEARAKSNSYAQDEQMRALEAKRQAELDGIIVNGRTREAYEAEIARLNLAIAERELALALGSTSGGSGGSGGSGNNNNNNNDTDTTPNPPAATGRDPKPAGSAGIGKKWVYSTVINDWVATPVPKPASPSEIGVTWVWSTPKEEWYKYTVPKPGPTYTWNNARDVWNAPSGGGPTPMAAGGLVGYSMGGRVAKRYLASGGSIGSDTVSAMLTPGEFVVKRPAVQGFGVKNLEAINNGKSASDSVYNYNVNLSVSSVSSPDEIARTVITKIKDIDRQRIRGNSY
jgi:hypothetical protein